MVNPKNRIDWDGVCRYRRGRPGLDINATIVGMIATGALSFFSEKGEGGVLEAQD